MYNKLLVALDLSDSSSRVLDRASGFAGGDNSKIDLVHVVESMPTTYGMESFAIDLNQVHKQIVAKSKEELIEFAGKHNIDAAKVHSVSGNPAIEIRDLAQQLEVDAIVIGSHGKSGWKAILGSTSNKVLHGAECDVLTVHVEE